MDPTEPIGAAIFQLDEQSIVTDVQTVIKSLLMVLKTDGLLCLLSEDSDSLLAIKSYLAKLPDTSYSVSYYQDVLTQSSALVVQRH